MTDYFSRSSKLSLYYNLMKMMQQFGLSFADCDINYEYYGYVYIHLFEECFYVKIYRYNTNIFLQISLFYGLKKA